MKRLTTCTAEKLRNYPVRSQALNSSGMKHYHKKLKYRPRVKKQQKFKMRDRVRHLTKYATDVNQKFYKSYTSGRDPNTAIWSKVVYTVEGSKQKNRMKQYFLTNNKWYYPYELQLVPYGVEKLEFDIPKEQKKSPQKKVVRFAPESNVWAELDPDNIIQSKQAFFKSWAKEETGAYSSTFYKGSEET